MNYREGIKHLKQKKNAVILAHYYQLPEVQDLADKTGDSLELSRYAAETDADIILFAGVMFMAETAKILNPGKKVLIPDVEAGCSLADSCQPEDFGKFLDENPDHKVVSYINCSAEIKAMSDVICTSSNALKIVESFPEDQPLIFAPDRNLGRYVMNQSGRKMLLWHGDCSVHTAFSIDKLLRLHKKHPDAKIVAHPEAEAHILQVAHFIGSTSKIISFIKEDPAKDFLVATEGGILHEIQNQVPEKNVIMAPSYEENTCACSECEFMKLNTLEKIYRCLDEESPQIHMEEDLRIKALKPIEKMLQIS